MTFWQSQEFLLEMVKKHLKVDFDDDDNYLRLLIMAATEYIDDAVNLAEQNNPANANRLLLLLLVIVADMYEHRSMSFEDHLEYHFILYQRCLIFSCYAAVNGVSQRDYWNARQQHEENTVIFRMRCCSALKLLNTVDYRIVCSGLIYDITGIDNVLFADSVLNIRGVIKDGESEGD